jgi:hypothetical protein
MPFAGFHITRPHMGLPEDWNRVSHWLDYGGPIFFDEKPSNIEND